MTDTNNLEIRDFIDLTNPSENILLNMSSDEAMQRIRSGDATRVAEIRGSFAFVVKEGADVFMARSISRPLRYFMAKQEAGPLLIVSERMDEIYECLKSLGFEDQFHPSYTRMVPAHYVTKLQVVGCPDPNPDYTRYFVPERNTLPADLNEIGKAYVGAMMNEVQTWLEQVPKKEPIGVLFSGGIDSGSVFLAVYHTLLKMGQSPARLKAFTLSVEDGPEAHQAYQFLDSLGLGMFLEVVEASLDDLDFREAIRVIEDYKMRDVEAATTTLALCKKIRELYPEWVHLADGDGGDENLKSYPIEENPELTIRSVLGNPLLYHEGWGVDKIKHSLTYSGGQSRGAVRTYAPASTLGFRSFSPYSLPSVIAISEGIPFIELTNWDHQKLYDLKGKVVRAGIRELLGVDMPVHPKRRMQEGTIGDGKFEEVFAGNEITYRKYFESLYR